MQENFIEARLNQSFAGILLSLFVSSAGFVLAAYLTGFCAVVTLLCLAFCVRESFAMSALIFNRVFTLGEVQGLRDTCKLYTTKYLVISAFLAASAFVQCCITLIVVYNFK